MDLSLFRIGGVRIPTASAFLRFLSPCRFGIVDRWVVKRYTQRKGITSFSVTKDGYINDTKGNISEYKDKYTSFLVNEAMAVNAAKVTYMDVDEGGNLIKARFRPCDVEMALFSTASATGNSMKQPARG